MYLFLLFVIYLSFVGLGLPEALLGSSWPFIRLEFSAALDFAGIISFIITLSKTLSGLVTDRIDKRLGHGRTAAFGMLLMSLSLFGCSLARSEYIICLFSLPLGASSGIVDTAINDYVSRNYTSRHMSWLHCCWGIGSMLSPFAVGLILSNGGTWRSGYAFIAASQLLIAFLLFLSLPRWVKISDNSSGTEKITVFPLKDICRLPGVAFVFAALFTYCGGEATANLWASSYLTEVRGIDPEFAAFCSSAIYVGVTSGRVIGSFVANKLGDIRLASIGGLFALTGAIILIVPAGSALLPLIGLFTLGLGCSPVVPSIIHSVPDMYGREYTSTIVGVYMAVAHAGSAFLPPLFGIVAEKISLVLYPFFLLFLMLVMFCSIRMMSENSKRCV